LRCIWPLLNDSFRTRRPAFFFQGTEGHYRPFCTLIDFLFDPLRPARSPPEQTLRRRPSQFFLLFSRIRRTAALASDSRIFAVFFVDIRRYPRLFFVSFSHLTFFCIPVLTACGLGPLFIAPILECGFLAPLPQINCERFFFTSPSGHRVGLISPGVPSRSWIVPFLCSGLWVCACFPPRTPPLPVLIFRRVDRHPPSDESCFPFSSSRIIAFAFVPSDAVEAYKRCESLCPGGLLSPLS